MFPQGQIHIPFAFERRQWIKNVNHRLLIDADMMEEFGFGKCARKAPIGSQ
jgi:hypothetical protein